MSETAAVDDIWVLRATFLGEHHRESTHSGPEEARARLEQWVDDFEVRDAYEAELAVESVSDGLFASEQDGDMVTWTIRRRP
ncbi:hypothetical protein [Mycolicibacterium vinylchloridicum]|uniref:hypothetical protein n=1 Tax=Mycolicibacterium vinylchloridicum TaxID=2736928 RepID=UPI0015C73D3C|nr:hypothetical protein [Mycolicibacterium vinylchloridicum]